MVRAHIEPVGQTNRTALEASRDIDTSENESRYFACDQWNCGMVTLVSSW